MMSFTNIYQTLHSCVQTCTYELTCTHQHQKEPINKKKKNRKKLTCDEAVVATAFGDCGRVPWVAPAGCPGKGGNPLYIGGKNGMGGNKGIPCPLLPGGGTIPGGSTMPGGGTMKGGG